MAEQVNGKAIPASMRGRAKTYHYEPDKVLGFNGDRSPILAGYGELVWEWSILGQEEYDYWVTTVLSGAYSAELTGTTELYGNDDELVEFDTVTVYKPTYRTKQSGYYMDVRLIISQMEEASE